MLVEGSIHMGSPSSWAGRLAVLTHRGHVAMRLHTAAPLLSLLVCACLHSFRTACVRRIRIILSIDWAGDRATRKSNGGLLALHEIHNV